MLVDSHCHLQFPQFDRDRDLVWQQARQAGVSACVVVGTDVESSRRALELADSHPDIYATVGLHPHHASQLNSRTLRALRRLADSPKVVAIGEIGLDYYRKLSPPDIQHAAFREMLDLAGQLRLPVVVHSRQAEGDTYAILESYEHQMLPLWPRERALGVMHCFGGDLMLALRYIQVGFLISIPGTCTYPKAERICAVAAGVPLRWLVVETDAPFLAPQSHRRKRNEPSYLGDTVARIAELRGQPFAEVANRTALNAARLFGLGDLSPALAAEKEAP